MNQASERRMTLVQHLEELRRVLIVSLIAWAITTMVGFFLSDFLLRMIMTPIKEVIGANHPLYFTGPVEKFLLYFKVGIVAGLVLASPIMAWQVWTFISPGLQRNERRVAAGFVLSASTLFALGIAFAFLAMPVALRFLTGFGTSDIQYFPLATSYINFALLLIAIFGITFELPLAMTMLGLAGIVTTPFLRRHRLKFWVGIFSGSMLITPGADPVTPTLLMVPLILLFEASILVISALRR